MFNLLDYLHIHDFKRQPIPAWQLRLDKKGSISPSDQATDCGQAGRSSRPDIAQPAKTEPNPERPAMANLNEW
jgi:hypothetical protein